MDTRAKNMEHGFEYEGLQVRIIEPVTNTYATVFLLKDGQYVDQFIAKRGDAEREAKERINSRLH